MKVFITILLMCPLLLMAQQYSLDELITAGLENSFSVQKSELSHKSAGSSLNSAKWNLAPDLSVTAAVNKDFDPAPGAEDLSSSAGFSLSKTISLNDPNYFGYKQAILNREFAKLSLDQSYQSYAYQVFEAYLEVLSAERRKSSLNENLLIQTRVWEQSKLLLQLGKTTAFEVKQNEIAVMNSQIAILELDNTISNARSRLFALVQMQDLGYPLADLNADLAKHIPSCTPDNSSELKLLVQQQKNDELQLTQGRLDNFPRLSMAYNFDRSVRGPDFDFDNYTTNHSIGMNLSYPLLNFFKNGESNTRLKIAKEISQLQIDEKRDQIIRDYDSAIKELQYLVRLDELYEEKLAQSREQIRQAEERYRLGMIELLELDKTRTDYIDADIAYNANRYKIISKQEAINYLLSQPVLGKW